MAHSGAKHCVCPDEQKAGFAPGAGAIGPPTAGTSRSCMYQASVSGVPRLIEFVVMSEHEMLHVVEGILAVVDAVHAGIEKIVAVVEGVTYARCEGGLGIVNPRSCVVAGLNAGLNQPMVVEFYCCQNSSLSKWISGK